MNIFFYIFGLGLTILTIAAISAIVHKVLLPLLEMTIEWLSTASDTEIILSIICVTIISGILAFATEALKVKFFKRKIKD